MKCYSCDTEIDSNWNYCPNCKRKIKKNKQTIEEYIPSEEIGKCHTCSCILNENWNFCPICGTSAEFYSEKPLLSIPTLATNTEVVAPVIALTPAENTKKEENALPKQEHSSFCPNCGTKVQEEQSFCAICGSFLKTQNMPISEEQKEVRTDNWYILWLILGFTSTFIGSLLSRYIHEAFSIIGVIVSLFSMIYVRAAYSKNKIVKICFIIYIGLAIFYIVAVLLFIYLTYLACATCFGELGGTY